MISDAVAARIAVAQRLIAEDAPRKVVTIQAETGCTSAQATSALRRARLGLKGWAMVKRKSQASRRGRRSAEAKPVEGPSLEARVKEVLGRASRISPTYVAAATGAPLKRVYGALRLARMSQEEREAERAYHHAASAEWRRANPERVREANRQWREANPERVREHQRRAEKVRAIRRAVGSAKVLDAGVRERGATAIAEPLHRRIAALVPADTPTYLADEIVSVVFLAVLEGWVEESGLQAAVAKARAGLWERTTSSRFSAISLDEKMYDDGEARLMDRLEDEAALDAFDEVLDRIDAERLAA